MNGKKVIVVCDPDHPSRGTLSLGAWSVPCALGYGGVFDETAKHEGDGVTPAGCFRFRKLLYRSDRLELPDTKLAISSIRKTDGWCDDPSDGAYNRAVTHPYPASAERLWRDDTVYDLIVVLGHNDDPPVPGKGSAVFLHIARDNFKPTEGCVALRTQDLLHLLTEISPDDHILIQVPDQMQ